MADHITVTVNGGGSRILQTTDNTTYHTPAHQIVNAAGTATLGVFAEDAAHSSAHTGLQILTVRQDTAAALSGTDADYQPLITDASGRLWCNIGDITPGTGATDLGKAEDAAHTTGDTGVFMLGVANSTHTTALSGTDGDYTPIGVDTTGKVGIRGTFAEDAAHTSADLGVHVLTVRQDTAAALSGTDADYQPFITDGSGRLHVNVGSFTPGTAAGSLGKAEDAAHTTGDTGVMALAVFNSTHTTALSGTDGDYTPIQVDGTGKVGVRGTFAEDAAHTTGDLGIHILAVANSTHTTALSGTDGDYTPLGVDTTGKLGIRGTFAEDAAHTSADLGIQVLTVRQDTAAALSGTDADYQPFITDGSGRLHVNVGAFTPGTAAGSLGKAEDAAHTTGDTGVMMLAVANSTHTGALSGTDGDYTPIAVDTTGKVGIRGTFAEDAAHSSGDLGVQILTVRQDTAAALAGTDADYQPLITDSTGKLHVNVGAVTPGSAATSLGKLEDAGHTTGDLGVMALAVRNDADADLSGTTLDYNPIATDSAGRVKVNAVSEYVILDVTPVCDTSAYDAGDVLFDRITCGTVTRLNGGVAILDSLVILDQDDQAAAAMTIYFLDSDVTLGTAGAVVSITDANATKIVGRVEIASGDFTDLIASRIAVKRDLNMPMKCDAASKILYIAATTAGTPTQTADGIKLKVGFRRA